MPNGAEEKFRWGDRRESHSFLKGKVGYRIAPSSAPVCALGYLPPEGKAFGRWERSEAVVGLFRAPCLSPDLGTFFRENAFQHIFPRKCVPNRSWYIGGNCPSAVSEITTTKTSEWERAAIKTRVQGGALVFFPPAFFKESRAPARGRAGNGALRPKAASEAPTRRVPPPQPPAGEPTWMVSPSIPHPRGKHNSPTGAAPVFRPTPPWLGGPPGTAAGQTPCPPGRWAGPPPPPGGGRSP